MMSFAVLSLLRSFIVPVVLSINDILPSLVTLFKWHKLYINTFISQLYVILRNLYSLLPSLFQWFDAVIHRDVLDRQSFILCLSYLNLRPKNTIIVVSSYSDRAQAFFSIRWPFHIRILLHLPARLSLNKTICLVSCWPHVEPAMLIRGQG